MFLWLAFFHQYARAHVHTYTMSVSLLTFSVSRPWNTLKLEKESAHTYNPACRTSPFGDSTPCLITGEATNLSSKLKW